jgi:endonuclease/exonuclease/phosphatase family metal-dependent hydrolase
MFLPLAFALAVPAQAQVPTYGSDATLDVAAWNVERFGTSGGPSNDAQQLQNVIETIRSADVDLWALQEMNDGDTFAELVATLGPPWAGERVVGTADIGYGFVYNTDVIRRVRSETILTSNSYQFAGRPPLEMVADAILPDTTVQLRFISLHMKATGDQESYERRLAAGDALLGYLEPRAAVLPYVVLGDFNDELIDSIRFGNPTPYQQILDSDALTFLTESFDQPGSSNDQNTYCSSSTCSSGSVLDHVLVTSNLVSDVVPGSTTRFDALLTSFPGYTNNTSDHLPVMTRFRFGRAVSTEGGTQPAAFALSPPSPNPFRAQSSMTYTLPAAAEVRLDVFDALGRQVQTLVEGRRPAGTHQASLQGAGLAPGLYVVRLTASGQTATRRLVRVR